MVVKAKTPPRPRNSEADEEDSSDPEVAAPQPAADPLRGVSSSGGLGKAKSTELEFSRLKHLVPSISKKQSVSKLDVILEAIRYIDQLQDQLLEQMTEQRLHPSLAADLILGKENAPGVDSLRRPQQPRK